MENITKSDINSFLAEIKKRAIDSLYNKKNKAKLEEGHKVITENNLDDDIKRLAEVTHEQQEIICRINSVLNKINGYPAPKNVKRTIYTANFMSYRYFSDSNVGNLSEFQKEIYAKVIDAVKSDDFISILNKYKEEIAETDSAYREVDRNIKSIRSIKKTIEYLKSLGFETDKIKHIEPEQPKNTPIANKENLFPCLKNSEKKEVS